MFSVTQRSRICVLLLLSLAPSILPSPPVSALPISLRPSLSFAALTTPVADTNISKAYTTPTKTSPSTIGPKAPFATLNPLKSLLATKWSSLSKQTPPLKSSPSAAAKTAYPLFRWEVSPRDPIHRLAVSHLSLTAKHISSDISRLLHHPCKYLTLPLRAIRSYLYRKLLLGHLSRVTSEKRPPHTAKLIPGSGSTLLPESTTQPQTASQKLPSPVSTLSFPTAFLPSASKTSPPPLGKASPFPFPNPTTSPPEASGQRGPLPPPRLPHSTGLLFEHQPFFVSWNIPDLVCNRHNISLDTSAFMGVATPAKVPGQFLSLFYTDRLGLYPRVDLASGKQVNGGIPQRGDLNASMSKARADINYYIPSKTSRGLAVIDWEEWRPLWDRNWGTKRIYQTLSVAHVMSTNRSLSVQQASERAKQQFQVAARGFMSGTLATGRAMRPNHLWGFYLFPNCYNYGWERPDYTGQCSEEARRQNDELLWLWESSTALYPSVYLQASLSDNPRAALMVRNRVQEALRVSALPGLDGAAPVFVYMRPVFVDQNRRFLSPADLISTIGESAAVGASGAVLWGASADFDDQTSCEALSFYLSSTLGPYVANVTAAAQLCGSFLCRGNGRCVRRRRDSGHHLHLNPEHFRVVRVRGRYLVLGRPTLADLKTLSRRFTCRCYGGSSCSPRTHRELAKALVFSVKQGLYQKADTLNKAMLDDSINKDDIKNPLKA